MSGRPPVAAARARGGRGVSGDESSPAGGPDAGCLLSRARQVHVAGAAAAAASAHGREEKARFTVHAADGRYSAAGRPAGGPRASRSSPPLLGSGV